MGIGPNKLVAKVASDAEKPAGFVVLTREQACARFAGSSPSLIPGIGPKTAERLAQLGVRRLGEMAALDPAVLVERFGPNLGRDLARARASNTTVWSRRRARSSRSRASAPSTPTCATPASCAGALSRMAAELCASLRAHGRSGRTIGIKVRLDDFTTVTRAHTLPEPTCDPEVVRRTPWRCWRSTRRRGRSGCSGCAWPGSTDGEVGSPEAAAGDRAGREQLALPV